MPPVFLLYSEVWVHSRPDLNQRWCIKLSLHLLLVFLLNKEFFQVFVQSPVAVVFKLAIGVFWLFEQDLGLARDQMFLRGCDCCACLTWFRPQKIQILHVILGLAECHLMLGLSVLNWIDSGALNPLINASYFCNPRIGSCCLNSLLLPL